MGAWNPNPLLCAGSSGGTQVFSQGQEGGAVPAELSEALAGTEQLLSLAELLSWARLLVLPPEDK